MLVFSQNTANAKNWAVFAKAASRVLCSQRFLLEKTSAILKWIAFGKR